MQEFLCERFNVWCPSRELRCGPGTMEAEGMCLPESASIVRCGPGTMQVQDVCTPVLAGSTVGLHVGQPGAEDAVYGGYSAFCASVPNQEQIVCDGAPNVRGHETFHIDADGNIRDAHNRYCSLTDASRPWEMRCSTDPAPLNPEP